MITADVASYFVLMLVIQLCIIRSHRRVKRLQAKLDAINNAGAVTAWHSYMAARINKVVADAFVCAVPVEEIQELFAEYNQGPPGGWTGGVPPILLTQIDNAAAKE